MALIKQSSLIGVIPVPPCSDGSSPDFVKALLDLLHPNLCLDPAPSVRPVVSSPDPVAKLYIPYMKISLKMLGQERCLGYGHQEWPSRGTSLSPSS